MKTKNLHKTINPNNRQKKPRSTDYYRKKPKSTLNEQHDEPAAIEINSKSNIFIDGKLVLFKSELEYLVRQITDNDSFTIEVDINNNILNTNINTNIVGGNVVAIGLEDYVCLDRVLKD